MTSRLVVVGTGIRAVSQMTSEARQEVIVAERVLHVVADPVTEAEIMALNPESESLIDLYDRERPRRATYQEMVERTLSPLFDGYDVCLAIYGHPGVFAAPGHEAIRRARAAGHPAVMLPGISTADCLFADLGIDPSVDGCQMYEATSFARRRILPSPRAGLMLWQVDVVGEAGYGSPASEAAIQDLFDLLRESYADDHPAFVYQAASFAVDDHFVELTTIGELASSPQAVRSAMTIYLPAESQT